MNLLLQTFLGKFSNYVGRCRPKNDFLPIMFQTLASFALVSVLTGCSTEAIESNKASGYSKKINRLCVISHLSAANKKIGAAAEEAFTRRLSSLKMDYKYFTANPLATTEDANNYNQAIKNYAPQAVLVLTMSRGLVDKHGWYISMKVDASLYDESSQKTVWRATTDTISTDMGEMADEVILALQKDNLIPSER